MSLQRTSLRDLVADRVRRLVLSGSLGPGEPVREPALAAELGVSRSPLREALLTLEFEGLLRSERNKGFSVRALDEEAVSEFYPVLGALEGLAVRLGGARLRERVPRLRELNEELRAGRRPALELAELDQRFHDELAEASANGGLIGMRSGVQRRVRLFDRRDERGMAALERSCDDHEAILAAIESGRPSRAARLVERHWETGVEIVHRWLRRARRERRS